MGEHPAAFGYTAICRLHDYTGFGDGAGVAGPFQHSAVAGTAQLTVSPSGNALGGLALVLGILRDDRADRERPEADAVVETARKSEQEANGARGLAGQLQKQVEQTQNAAERLQAEAQQERQRAEHEGRQAALGRQRVDRADAELRRSRDGQQLEARSRRLEEALRLRPQNGAADNQSEES